jgi:hypothetical protein
VVSWGIGHQNGGGGRAHQFLETRFGDFDMCKIVENRKMLSAKPIQMCII